MFRKLTKIVASAVGMSVVVASLAMAQGGRMGSADDTIAMLVVIATLGMAHSSKQGALDDTITYAQGVVTTMENTGTATVQTDRGVQYVILGNGLKVGDKVECTTKEEHTACGKIS